MSMQHRPFAGLGLALALVFTPNRAAAVSPGATPAFQDCLAQVRQWGADLPQWVVYSAALGYAARKPAFDAGGYPRLGADGHQLAHQVLLTGRVFFPPDWRVADGSSLPLVVYAHGTELQKQACPSRFGGEEWPLGAAAAAAFGFAVAMPDLPGMGGDAGSFHPYCHAASLAYAIVDSIPAAVRLFTEDPYLVQHRLTWDGRLYLVGYSEGGYATLAAVKEVETHAAAYAAQAHFTLTGSACMAGPFDLSGAMRTTFIDPVQGYPRSYYLPYFVRGYHGVYGPRLEPGAVFAPSLLATRADGNLLAWTDGTQDGLAVDAEVGKRLGMPPNAIDQATSWRALSRARMARLRSGPQW